MQRNPMDKEDQSKQNGKRSKWILMINLDKIDNEAREKEEDPNRDDS